MTREAKHPQRRRAAIHPPSMVNVRCLQAFDKYKTGVVYTVKPESGEKLVGLLPECFEWEEVKEDDFEGVDASPLTRAWLAVHHGRGGLHDNASDAEAARRQSRPDDVT